MTLTHATILSASLLLYSACELTTTEVVGGADGGVDADQDDLDEIAAGTMPNYQMPFHCGAVWRGNTYTTHSPQRAIDFNHDGIDFGRDVLAAASGDVTVVADTGADSYGKWIEIGHGGQHRTRYAHLSSRNASVGQHVVRGQKIGEVGESGGATGPHLHFEERHDGIPISIRFNGSTVVYFGERYYTSHNCN